jgi:hypothetical protein
MGVGGKPDYGFLNRVSGVRVTPGVPQFEANRCNIHLPIDSRSKNTQISITGLHITNGVRTGGRQQSGRVNRGHPQENEVEVLTGSNETLPFTKYDP